MGIPVIADIEAAILELSHEDRIKVIAWIAETMLPEEENEPEENEPSGRVEEPAAAWPPPNMRIAKDESGKTPWYEGIDPPGTHLSDEEWKARVDSVAGLWSDLPDDFGEDIVSSRTISTREINLDD